MLFTLLSITHHVQKNNAPVFNVRIIEPLEIQPSKSPPKNITKEIRTETKKPLIEKKPPAKTFTRPELYETTKPPDTLYGEDIESIQQGTETQEHRDEKVTEGYKGQSATEDAKTSSGKEETGTSPSEDIKPDPYTFLFDRETIEKFAKRSPADNRGLTFDAPEFKHRGYMRMLKQRIESIWMYPKDAVRQGISGDLYIKFSIKKDGSLGEIELVRTSGYRSLDKAAMKAIRDAQPFWPLPEDWHKDDLVINGHFIYILGETLVM